MSEPDSGVEDRRDRDMRFDNWPVERYDTMENWDVENETPVERPGTKESDVEWLGFAGGSGQAFVYEPDGSAIYRGEVDEENERFVADETHSELESDDSLGQRLEAIGEEHGWTWLSSFAREHLEHKDEDVDEYRVPDGVSHELTKFQRRNVLEDADPDIGFFGSHTFADETDRAHMLERDFDVYQDEGTDSATVHVIERYLVADDPEAERREGDATIVDEREFDLSVEADADDAAWEGHLESTLERWHERHLGPPPEPERP